LRYIARPSGSFIDRTKKEPDLEQIDVVMLTLDPESFLEVSLFSIYREIPVRKLFVCDGGSKDNTQKILKKFPRVEVYVKPEIRTTGKGIEFLISHVETDWFVFVDSDIELAIGWYDEMRNHEKDLDVIENSKRTLAYHMSREDKIKLQENRRSLDLCHLIKKTAVKNFQCDDDYMSRFTDYFLRQVVEESGYKYGKVNSTEHIHNETERIIYESDNEKNFQKIVWKEPKWIVIDKEKLEMFKLKHAKAVIKYLDPEFFMVKNDKAFEDYLFMLERDWVQKNGPKWLTRYDRVAKNLMLKTIRKSIRKFKLLYTSARS